MNKRKTTPTRKTSLRKRAEKKLAVQLERLQDLNAKGTKELVQELGTHQIELEMQVEELQRSQEALEGSRSKYLDLYDFSPVGYLTLDTAGLIREINLTAATLLNITRHTLLNKPFLTLVHKDDRDAFHLHHTAVLKERTKQTVELRLRRRGGPDPCVLLESIAVEDLAGNAVAVRTAMSDISERIRSEQALNESEQRYRQLFENMLDGYAYCRMVYDDRGRPKDFVYLSVNTAFEQLTGQKDVVGKRVTEIFPGIRESHPELLEACGRVAATGRTEKLELEFEPLNMWLAIAVYNTERGCFAAVFDNITERRRAEQAVLMINQHLEEIVDRRTMEVVERAREVADLYNNAPCGYHSIDIDGVIVRINDTELSWLGYDRKEVVGRMKITDFYTAEGVRVYQETFPVLRRRGWISNVELELVRKDGSTFPVLLNATTIRDGDGNFVMSRTTLVDITERKKAEAENRRLLSAVEAAADAVIITEPMHGRIQYVNAAFERVTGYSRSEAAGATLHLLDSGKPDETLYRQVREAVGLNGTWEGRIMSKRKDGSFYVEERSTSAVRDPSGVIVNYMTVIRDVTERLQHEAIGESVSAMDNIGSVFAGVRHEIGNPINSINMVLGILRNKLDELDPDSVRSYLGKIGQQVERIEFILRSLRNFNLFETQDPQAVPLRAFLEQFLPLVREDIEQRGIPIAIEAGDDAVLRCDPRALQQVLLNLVVNAADALAGRPSPRINISASRSDGGIRITVQDNGCGIPEGRTKDIFKPFYTTKTNGTGLGLVIVKKMMTMMNGTIAIESRMNAGTRVELTLPEVEHEAADS